MKKIYYISIILILYSCIDKTKRITDKDSKELDSTTIERGKDIVLPADSFFLFYNNCQLSNDRIKEREKGKNIVFHYHYNNTDFASASDEEYFEQIQFEINPANIKDSLFTENLKDVNLRFNWGCYCDCLTLLKKRKIKENSD